MNTMEINSEKKNLLSYLISRTSHILINMHREIFAGISGLSIVRETEEAIENMKEVLSIISGDELCITASEAEYLREIHTMLRKCGDDASSQLLYRFHEMNLGLKVFLIFLRHCLDGSNVDTALDQTRDMLVFSDATSKENLNMLDILTINRRILEEIMDHILKPKECIGECS